MASPIDYKKYGKGGKKGSKSLTSFDEKTMQELQESFKIMDRNKDGVIDKSDLMDIYAYVGLVPSGDMIDKMLKEAPGTLNFGMFMSTFAAKLVGTIDPAETLIYAFKMFDKEDSGTINEKIFKKILTTTSGPKSLVQYEPLTEEEISQVMAGNPPISGGKLDYVAFSNKIAASGDDQ